IDGTAEARRRARSWTRFVPASTHRRRASTSPKREICCGLWGKVAIDQRTTTGATQMGIAGQGTPDDIDVELGERYYGGSKEAEERFADEITEVIAAFINRRFSEGRRPAMRDAHATDTGCVRAVVAVDADLGPALRQGVSVPGTQYKAWIRFSNGTSERLSARLHDAGGMAIRLVGVPVPRLIGHDKATGCCLLAS